MKILFYSTKPFEKPYLEASNQGGYETRFLAEPLSLQTADAAKGFAGVSIFTADDGSAPVLEKLKELGGALYCNPGYRVRQC